MELEVLRVYKVVKGSSDGTVRPDTCVWLGDDGNLYMPTERLWVLKKWISPEMMDFEAVPYKDYVIENARSMSFSCKLDEEDEGLKSDMIVLYADRRNSALNDLMEERKPDYKKLWEKGCDDEYRVYYARGDKRNKTYAFSKRMK